MMETDGGALEEREEMMIAHEQEAGLSHPKEVELVALVPASLK